MSKPKFDLDLFWSLPRCESSFTTEGKYCALGAGMKAMRYREEDFGWRTVREAFNLDYDLENSIYRTNDGIASISEYIPPNHEKAKRMLLEALEGKVEFVSKEVTFTEDKEYAV